MHSRVRYVLSFVWCILNLGCTMGAVVDSTFNCCVLWLKFLSLYFYLDFCRAILQLLMMSLGVLTLSIAEIRRKAVQFMVLTRFHNFPSVCKFETRICKQILDFTIPLILQSDRSTLLVMGLEMYCMMQCGKKLGKLLRKSEISLKRYFFPIVRTFFFFETIVRTFYCLFTIGHWLCYLDIDNDIEYDNVNNARDFSVENF